MKQDILSEKQPKKCNSGIQSNSSLNTDLSETMEAICLENFKGLKVTVSLEYILHRNGVQMKDILDERKIERIPTSRDAQREMLKDILQAKSK